MIDVISLTILVYCFLKNITKCLLFLLLLFNLDFDKLDKNFEINLINL